MPASGGPGEAARRACFPRHRATPSRTRYSSRRPVPPPVRTRHPRLRLRRPAAVRGAAKLILTRGSGARGRRSPPSSEAAAAAAASSGAAGGGDASPLPAAGRREGGEGRGAGRWSGGGRAARVAGWLAGWLARSLAPSLRRPPAGRSLPHTLTPGATHTPPAPQPHRPGPLKRHARPPPVGAPTAAGRPRTRVGGVGRRQSSLPAAASGFPEQ